MSLDQYKSDDDGGDTSDRHVELIDPNAVISEDEKLSDDVLRLREIIATCSEKQKEAHRLVHIEGLSKTEAAKVAGCSQPAMCQRINGVEENIKKNF